MAERLKSEGNEAFQRKDFKVAEAKYSEALQLSEKEGKEERSLQCALLTNRSNARFALGRYQESIADADQALALDSSWVKAYFRKGAALSKLGEIGKARQAYETGLKHCNAEHKPTLEALLKKLNAKEGNPKVNLPSLYPDQASAAGSEEERERKAAEKNLARLREKLTQGSTNQDVLLDGLLSKLIVPEKFRQIVYRSREVPEDPSMPKTFQELLANDLYVNALVLLFPKIRAKAESVLENVKAKAAKEGQFMDAETERLLKPQVLNEAFAHQVVDMIHDVKRKQNALLAEADELFASPEVDEASFDQISPQALEQLLNDEDAYCILDGFMDDGEGEWQDLLRADATDVIESGLLEQRDVASSSKRELMEQDSKVSLEYFGCNSTWLSAQQMEENFTALHEVFTRIVALPHELNKKSLSFKLRKPLGAGGLFLAIGPILENATNDAGTEYKGYPSRLDGSFGVENNGILLTAVYFFNPGWVQENKGHLVLKNIRSCKSVSIEPKADRLVIFRSRVVENSCDAIACPAQPRFSLSVFLNGPPDLEHSRW